MAAVFFLLTSNDEKDENLQISNHIAQKLKEDKDFSWLSLFDGEQELHITLLNDINTEVLYDNFGRTEPIEVFNKEKYPFDKVIFEYDYDLKDKTTFSVTYIKEQSAYLFIHQKVSMLYRWARGSLLYGSLFLLVIDAICYYILYLSFTKSLRPLKLQVQKLQDIAQHNSVIEYEDDLDYLTAIIRSTRHELKHLLERNLIGDQKIRFIMDSFSQALIVIDGSFHVVMINQKALEIFSKDRENIEKRLFDNLHAPHDLSVNFSMVLQTSDSLSFIEKINGRVYQCDINPIFYSWVKNTAQRQSGASLLMIDITEDYNSGEMKKEFFANASHELKSPLTSILGYLQLIQNKTIQGDYEEVAIAKCIDDAHRMNTIISDMLTLSSVEKENLRQIEEVDIPKAIRSIIDSLKIQIQEKNIKVKLYLDPFTFKINPEDFDQLVRNLIVNGIKYNKENGSLIIRMDSENRALSVKDAGIGISKENQARIFERFFRVDKARSRKNGGTGLGLAIVKHICNYYDLSISVTSELDVGSQFTIHFPNQNNSN